MKKCFIIVIILCLLFRQETIYATGIAEIDDFNNLEGDEKYLGDNYRDNYSLDIEKTGILDSGEKMLNNIANVLFSVLRVSAHLICSIFYFAMDFDITSILGNQIDSIQAALKSSIFNPLFKLAFVGVAIILIKRLMKQDIAGILSEMGKVIAIVLISIFVVNNSSAALSNTTKITKSVCVDVLTEMNSSMGVTGGSGASYASKASGVLWVNLIHLPWVSLEFGNTNPDAETIEKFLSSRAGSDERKELVKSFDDGTFDKGKGAARIGLIVVYSVPFFIKGAIYLIIALLNLVFQLLALFFVLAAPIILLLALIPGFENIIGMWLKKILETQVSILILTILMALLIKMDTACYSLIPQYGWFVGIIFQTALGLGLFLSRNKILHAFANMQRGVSNPGIMQTQMKHMGNPYKAIENMQRQIKVTQVKRDRIKGEREEKVQFTMPDSEIKTKDDKNSTRTNRPTTQAQTKSINRQNNSKKESINSRPDYVATPTSYNQIDTSNINEMWNNAVPKSELKQEQGPSNKKSPKQSSNQVVKRTQKNNPKMATADTTAEKNKVVRPVTYSTTESTKTNLNKQEVNELENRPILLNGKPLERRPSTSKRKINSNKKPSEDYSKEELKQMPLNGRNKLVTQNVQANAEQTTFANRVSLEAKKRPSTTAKKATKESVKKKNHGKKTRDKTVNASKIAKNRKIV